MTLEACVKKAKVELELLKYGDMLQMIQKGIKDGMCHAIHRYAKANDKYMKDYDLSTEYCSSCTEMSVTFMY